VVASGSAGAIMFGNSGTMQLDSLMAFGGTISGFQLGDGIDLRGLEQEIRASDGPDQGGTHFAETLDRNLVVASQYNYDRGGRGVKPTPALAAASFPFEVASLGLN
jgi:hypothetical protein